MKSGRKIPVIGGVEGDDRVDPKGPVEVLVEKRNEADAGFVSPKRGDGISERPGKTGSQAGSFSTKFFG